MFPTTIPPFQGRHSTSVGESNAVFLRGVGGDAATEPHKTGCSGYPEEEFSGMHNLAVAEATEFLNNFYIRVKETSTGVNAFKILVSRNGGISPEPGPNMMWNAKYSPMANMMGRWFVPNARNSVSLAQAKAKAQFCPAQKRTL